MDPRWEKPAITRQNTLEDIEKVADRAASILEMVSSALSWSLQEGISDEMVKQLRATFTDMHNEEREKTDGRIYNESVIRTVFVASIVLREVGDFLDLAARDFIVDYEVEYGGIS